MVDVRSKPVDRPARPPRFLYLTGCDGTGKSTQARLLVDALHVRGIHAQPLWLRFPFLFSAPFLLYARRRGLSWFEQQGTVRHGYWNFGPSRLMRSVFPWVLLVDAALAALAKVYLPLWMGRTIVCERFALDMLADLAVGLGDPSFHRRLPGRLFARLIPTDSVVIGMDADLATIRVRRPDLQSDHRLADRLDAFRRLFTDLGISVYRSDLSIEAIASHILAHIDRGAHVNA